MQLVARTLRYLGIRFSVGPRASSQDTARANAAEASAQLRQRRVEQADVDAFLHERRQTYGE